MEPYQPGSCAVPISTALDDPIRSRVLKGILDFWISDALVGDATNSVSLGTTP